ncbi:MAG: hemerythrin domain-containing protein [Polyangiaceae bacterium]
MHDDLFDRLEHDHAPVSAVMLEIRDWFAEPDADAVSLRDKLVLLRELVIEHFGEEEEIIFPILSEVAPESALDLTSLAAAHDAICGLSVRLGSVAERPDPDRTTMRALFERLEVSYGEHAKREQAILRGIRDRLTAEALTELTKRLRAVR